MLRDLATVDAKLQELAAGNPSTLKLLGPIGAGSAVGLPTDMAFNWFSLRTFSTLFAGLVVGVLSASVAWAIMVPRMKDGTRAVSALLTDSFEGGEGFLVTGVPTQTEQWSGDYSEIVGEQQGLRPASGTKMLRILRADYEGKTASGSYIGDVYRLMDLRPYRHEVADGRAVIQLSASFNALPFLADEQYQCSISVFALDAHVAQDASSRLAATLTNESLAMARQNRMSLDRDPRTWQKMQGELRLPVNTDFVLIRLGVSHVVKSQRRDTFAGHYIDDVHVSLARPSTMAVSP
jgi:hypothetical protein